MLVCRTMKTKHLLEILAPIKIYAIFKLKSEKNESSILQFFRHLALTLDSPAISNIFQRCFVPFTHDVIHLPNQYHKRQKQAYV
jgi:hypothetical protein